MTIGFLTSSMQVEQPFAALAAEEPVFVLNIQQFGRMAVDEFRHFFVAVAVLFGEARDDVLGHTGARRRQVRRSQSLRSSFRRRDRTT